MIRSTPRKRGRPQARHRMADGKEILGLTRRPDGRWRVSATGETFTEPDEKLAVARFLAIAAARDVQSVLLPVDTEGLDIESAFDRASTTDVNVSFSLGEKPRVERALPGAEFWAAVRKLI